jgi:hypothetical protein
LILFGWLDARYKSGYLPALTAPFGLRLRNGAEWVGISRQTSESWDEKP